MAQQCPLCRQDDIADKAIKCHHCGSWLDASRNVNELEEIRRDIRSQLSADLDKHRAGTERLLSRMQVFAGIVVAIAGGFAVYFTGITRENVNQTSSRIEESARTKVETAVNAATQKAIDTVDATVTARMDTPDMRQLIATTIAGSVRDKAKDAVAERFTEIEAEVDAIVADVRNDVLKATEPLNALQADTAETLRQIEDQKARADAALAQVEAQLGTALATIDRVEGIDASYATAQDLQVASSDAVLQFQTVEAEAKEGLDAIPGLVAAKVNALTFQLGGFYYAPVAWKYLEELTQVPEFQFVVLLAADGQTVHGFWDARALTAGLNPPEIAELRTRLAGREPQGEDDIPAWKDFADQIGAGDTAALAQLAGFRPASDLVHSDWTNFQALGHMERLGADHLPVVDGNDILVGSVDRSRLTTRMLLAIAGAQN